MTRPAPGCTSRPPCAPLRAGPLCPCRSAPLSASASPTLTELDHSIRQNNPRSGLLRSPSGPLRRGLTHGGRCNPRQHRRPARVCRPWGAPIYPELVANIRRSGIYPATRRPFASGSPAVRPKQPRCGRPGAGRRKQPRCRRRKKSARVAPGLLPVLFELLSEGCRQLRYRRRHALALGGREDARLHTALRQLGKQLS